MHPQQPPDQQRKQEQQQQQGKHLKVDEGTQYGPKDVQQERILLETSNATSLNSTRETALARKAHFQAIQEACLNEAQVASLKVAVALKGNTYIGGPTDPEQGKAAAGVGALFHKDLAAYDIPKPTEDDLDAEKTGDTK